MGWFSDAVDSTSAWLNDPANQRRAGYAALTLLENTPVGSNIHIAGRETRAAGAVDGFVGSFASIGDMVFGNEGGTLRGYVSRGTRWMAGYDRLDASRREMFNGGAWAGEGVSYVAGGPATLGTKTTLMIGGGIVAKAIYNGASGIDTEYRPEEPPLPGALPKTPKSDITTGSNALTVQTQNLTATFASAAKDGAVSNADIAALKENATALKGAKLSDAERAASAKEAATIIRDFEKNPPAWTDARTYRLQVLLGIDADSICGKDTNEAMKQFKLDHKTLFTQPAPVLTPH